MFVFNRPLSKDAIDDIIPHYQIFKFYSPQLEYGRVIVSPLRKEANASFGIFKSRSGQARYNDMASQDSGDVYDYVQRLFNLDFRGALNKINIDFNLKLLTSYNKELPKSVGITNYSEPTGTYKTVIEVIYRQWNRNDKEYWKQFGISLLQAHEAGIRPITYFRINNGTLNIADELAYSIEFYDQGDGIMMRKIYQPLSKTTKWRTNLNDTVVPNIKRLPARGNILVITKSIKDAIVLTNYGYNAISTNSESTFIPHEVFEKLKIRFSNIILFFDSDAAGRKNSEILAKRNGIREIFIPDTWNKKDISDFRAQYGHATTRDLLTTIIEKEYGI